MAQHPFVSVTFEPATAAGGLSGATTVTRTVALPGSTMFSVRTWPSPLRLDETSRYSCAFDGLVARTVNGRPVGTSVNVKTPDASDNVDRGVIPVPNNATCTPLAIVPLGNITAPVTVPLPGNTASCGVVASTATVIDALSAGTFVENCVAENV